VTVRAVLFDWTGTLAYQDRARRGDPLAALTAELDRQRAPVNRTDLRTSLRDLLEEHGDNIALADLVTRAVGRHGHTPTGTQLAALTSAFARAMLSGQELYDDARAMLSSLKYRGYRTAVVSNLIVSGDVLRSHLAAQGAGGYFDAVITSGDVGRAKPHPAPFLAALRALSLAPAAALAIGDSPETDIAGARAAGIAAVLLDRHGQYPDASARRITRLTGLNSLLGEGTASLP
jgi:HAD superfamily hydrolase (TIGR01509 family)